MSLDCRGAQYSDTDVGQLSPKTSSSYEAGVHLESVTGHPPADLVAPGVEIQDTPSTKLERRATNSHATNHFFGRGSQRIIAIEKKHNDRHNLPFLKQPLLLRPSPRQYWAPDGTLVRDAGERRTSFSELFYDLIYVGGIAKFSIDFRAHPDLSGLEFFIVKFLMLYRVWGNIQQYNNRFSPDDALHHWLLVIPMILIAGLAIFSSTLAPGFYIFAALLFVYLTCLYLFAWFYADPDCPADVSKLCRYHVFWNGITVVVLIVGGAFDLFQIESLYFSCFLFIPEFVLVFHLPKKIMGEILPVNVEFLHERMGLMIIICLGEVVVAALGDFAQMGFLSLFILLLGYEIHWIYFESQEQQRSCHALRLSKFRGATWGFSHAFLALTIVLQGACAELLAHSSVSTGHGIFDDVEITWIYSLTTCCLFWVLSVQFCTHGLVDNSRIPEYIRWVDRRYRVGLMVTFVPLIHIIFALMTSAHMVKPYLIVIISPISVAPIIFLDIINGTVIHSKKHLKDVATTEKTDTNTGSGTGTDIDMDIDPEKGISET